MDDTTVKKDVISALVDAFDDKSENVREQAIKSISVIGLKHPGLTADTLLNIRRKNAALLTDRTRYCLWTCLCKMIPEKDFKSNISSETVEELLSASVTDSRRRGDSGQLARHFLVLSVSNFGEDSYHVVINSLQSKADIQLMCTLSQMLTNPAKLRASTFDKTLDVLLALMPTMKHSEEKIVVAESVLKVAEALKEFSVADERPTSNGNASEVEEEIWLNDYRGKVDECYQYILSNWLGRSRSSKGEQLCTMVRVLGGLTSIVSMDKIHETGALLLKFSIEVFHKHPENEACCVGVASMLETITLSIPKTLEPQLDSVIEVLFSEACFTPDYDNQSSIKAHNEILRAYANIGRYFTDRSCNYLLQRIDTAGKVTKSLRHFATGEQGQEKIVNGAIALLNKMLQINEIPIQPMLASIFHYLKKIMSPTAVYPFTANSVKQTILTILLTLADAGYIGAENIYCIEFIVRCASVNVARKVNEPAKNEITNLDLKRSAENVLTLMSDAIEGMQKLLWPNLFQYLIPIEYSNAATCVCKCLCILCEKNDVLILKGHGDATIPTPTALFSRLIVLSSRLSNETVISIDLLKCLIPALRAGSEKIWNECADVLPTLLKNKDSIQSERDWEEMLIESLASSINCNGDEKLSDDDRQWSLMMSQTLAQQLRMYRADAFQAEKLFVFAALSTILGFVEAEENSDSIVYKCLDLMFEDLRHEDLRERTWLAKAVGRISFYHCDAVLNKILSFEKNEIHKQHQGFFKQLFTSSESHARNQFHLFHLEATAILCRGCVIKSISQPVVQEMNGVLSHDKSNGESNGDADSENGLFEKIDSGRVSRASSRVGIAGTSDSRYSNGEIMKIICRITEKVVAQYCCEDVALVGKSFAMKHAINRFVSWYAAAVTHLVQRMKTIEFDVDKEKFRQTMNNLVRTHAEFIKVVQPYCLYFLKMEPRDMNKCNTVKALSLQALNDLIRMESSLKTQQKNCGAATPADEVDARQKGINLLHVMNHACEEVVSMFPPSFKRRASLWQGSDRKPSIVDQVDSGSESSSDNETQEKIWLLTMTNLKRLILTLFEVSGSPLVLHNFIKLAQQFTEGDLPWEQENCLQLLEAILVKVDKEVAGFVIEEHVGDLIALLVPRCVDSDIDVRRRAVKCMRSLLIFAQASVAEAQIEKWASELNRDEKDLSLLANGVALLSESVCECLRNRSIEQCLEALKVMCEKGILDSRASSASATVYVTNELLKAKGEVIDCEMIPDILRRFVQAHRKLVSASTITNGDAAAKSESNGVIRNAVVEEKKVIDQLISGYENCVLSLAVVSSSHMKETCKFLLHQAFPYDRTVSSFWCALSSGAVLRGSEENLARHTLCDFILNGIIEDRSPYENLQQKEREESENSVKHARLGLLEHMSAFLQVVTCDGIREDMKSHFPQLFVNVLLYVNALVVARPISLLFESLRNENKEEWQKALKVAPLDIAVNVLKEVLSIGGFGSVNFDWNVFYDGSYVVDGVEELVGAIIRQNYDVPNETDINAEDFLSERFQAKVSDLIDEMDERCCRALSSRYEQYRVCAVACFSALLAYSNVHRNSAAIENVVKRLSQRLIASNKVAASGDPSKYVRRWCVKALGRFSASRYLKVCNSMTVEEILPCFLMGLEDRDEWSCLVALESAKVLLQLLPRLESNTFCDIVNSCATKLKPLLIIEKTDSDGGSQVQALAFRVFSVLATRIADENESVLDKAAGVMESFVNHADSCFSTILVHCASSNDKSDLAKSALVCLSSIQQVIIEQHKKDFDERCSSGAGESGDCHVDGGNGNGKRAKAFIVPSVVSAPGSSEYEKLVKDCYSAFLINGNGKISQGLLDIYVTNASNFTMASKSELRANSVMMLACLLNVVERLGGKDAAVILDSQRRMAFMNQILGMLKDPDALVRSVAAEALVMVVCEDSN